LAQSSKPGGLPPVVAGNTFVGCIKTGRLAAGCGWEHLCRLYQNRAARRRLWLETPLSVVSKPGGMPPVVGHLIFILPA